jgi:hypothetical protein
MPQLSLVALYGDKTSEFSGLLSSLQQLSADVIGTAFRPYVLKQVHATIVGLEGQAGSPLVNACFKRFRGKRVQMDIPGFLHSLRESAELPFVVQIGGFADTDRPFLSRRAPPYQRSFSVQGDKTLIIGWPQRSDPGEGPPEWPQTLDSIRRGAQGFGILHAYHRTEKDSDNDFFLRIGLIERNAVEDDAVRSLEERVRRHMSRQPPLALQIGLEDLFVVAYRDERLPLDSTQHWSIKDTELEKRLFAVTGV